MKRKEVHFIIYVAVIVLVTIVLNVLYARFVTQTPYRFSPNHDLANPLALGIVTGYLLFLRKKEE